MTRYRIIKVTYTNDSKVIEKYQIQRRFLFFFWVYETFLHDACPSPDVEGLFTCRYEFDTYEEALEYVNNQRDSYKETREIVKEL